MIIRKRGLWVKDGMTTKHVHVGALDVKAVDDEGEFEGHGSVFGTVDSYREIVAAGAFKKSLAAHKKEKTLPALLWQHDPAQPIGAYSEMAEDDEGLFVRGRLELKTQAGAEAHALLKGGALRGLSIGYLPVKWKYDEETKLTTLTEVDLWEVSVVTFAANRDAQVEAVKNWKKMETRELERALRDVGGFSQGEVKRMISALKNEPINRDGCIDSDVLAETRKLIATMK